MSKIIVYEHVDFQGMSREFTSSVSNLVKEYFNDCISSLIVIGNPWVAYQHINFKGNLEVYEEGHYPRLESNDTISSLEMVTEDLTNPQITLYEHRDYEGRRIVLNEETNLCYASFNDLASSHKVQRGVWLLYEHPNRHGEKLLARASLDVPFVGWMNDRLSHAYPLKAGTPTVTASEVLWDKKEEHVKSVVLDTISGLNYGEHEQSFSTELHREYTGSVTESFNFTNATNVTYGASFGINLFEAGVTMNSSLSNTFTVERGGSNTRSETKSVRISLPATIPPHTKLTVNVVRKEVDLKVPVKLTITTGPHSKEEDGEYRCQFANSINTEYKEEKL
ncbi:hypothetical protein NFI96_009237 [Prochilodus magdalenae]|nr:hypothetical protein NFI96_009237 [Prochilodus magdalenae]